jgi:lysophospholipase L1-like esterase
LDRRLEQEIGMLQDFAARGIAVQNRSIRRRLAVLDMLVMGTPIAESLNAASQIASSKHWTNRSDNAAQNYEKHYSYYGGAGEYISNVFWRTRTGHLGNGTDPAANPNYAPSSTIRFATHADKFEIYAVNLNGFRVKVNGKYTKAGLYGNPTVNGVGSGLARHFLFDFTGTEFAGTGLKLVEVQGYADLRFGAVSVGPTFTVFPWPQPFALRAALHGDSMVSTFSDAAGVYEASAHGLMPHILQQLTGICDIWANSIGSVGFVTDGGTTNSTFIEQLAADFSDEKFDLVWELGGRNDGGSYGSQGAYQLVVESWIRGVLADNPDALIFLTGPLMVTTAEAAAASAQAMQAAKKAAAATFPRNCAFIQTCGNATVADPWIFGTGKQGATTGNGNADTVRGNDGTHPTVFGHQYLGTRLAQETARVIPWLAGRIRDGVVSGVNNLDLV